MSPKETLYKKVSDLTDGDSNGETSLEELMAAISVSCVVKNRPLDLGKEVITALQDGHRIFRDHSFYAGYGDNGSLKRWKYNALQGSLDCMKA